MKNKGTDQKWTTDQRNLGKTKVQISPVTVNLTSRGKRKAQIEAANIVLLDAGCWDIFFIRLKER